MKNSYFMQIPEMLYDAEIIKGGLDTTVFFKRPISQSYRDDARVKLESDTNMNQPEMLDYPKEFSVTGFGCYLERGTSIEDTNEIFNGGVFSFAVRGYRSLFSQPLMVFPNFCRDRQSSEDVKDALGKALTRIIGGNVVDVSASQKLRDILPLVWPDDQEALRIKSGEAFSIGVEFPHGLKLSKPVRMMVVIDGYAWVPKK